MKLLGQIFLICSVLSLSFQKTDTETCHPMKESVFDKLMIVMQGRAPESTKLKHATEEVEENCISTEQTQLLLPTLQTDEYRLELAKKCFDFCSNPKKFKNNVVDLMKSASSKKALEKYIKEGKH